MHLVVFTVIKIDIALAEILLEICVFNGSLSAEKVADPSYRWKSLLRNE